MANALGRTSGGRYIVPADWIIAFYFALGLIECILILRKPADVPTAGPTTVRSTAPAWRGIAAVAAQILVLAAILPLIELPFPRRYLPLDSNADPGNSQVLNEIAVSTGYSRADLSAFLKTDAAAVLLGRAMYPRYFSYAAAIQAPEDSLTSVGYPRLEFQFIGPPGDDIIVLSGPLPARFPNASDAVVLGCRQDRHIEALIIILHGPETMTYARAPGAPLACPLPPPTCDNNGNCGW
jgi:hypothetical protein